jgi:hypothetical protein
MDTLLVLVMGHFLISSGWAAESTSKLQKGADGQLELVVRAKRRLPANVTKDQHITPPLPPKTKNITCDSTVSQPSIGVREAVALPLGACRIDAPASPPHKIGK